MPAEELAQRTLLLVAHPDDDVLGCGILLQRIQEPFIVFCTDGAPRACEYWARYGSRERYAEVRRQEARSALAAIGIQHAVFLPESKDGSHFVDQDLFLAIPRALPRLFALIETLRPTALLTHAYEGGHPDHDACCFLAHVAARQHGLPVWEFPLYHRNEAGEFRCQQFPLADETEVSLSATAQELAHKQHMMSLHASQKEVLQQFDPGLERFRPMAAYDFSLPPHPGTLNYEAWGWPMTGKQLCAAFNACTQKRSLLDLPITSTPRMAA
jgi:LmbE family N-acetylglucosaminyl deacetylase